MHVTVLRPYLPRSLVIFKHRGFTSGCGTT